MPFSIIALTLAAFAIGTSEFIVMGLLPEVATALNVDLPHAGLIVTVYAMGVVFGGPVLSMLTAGIPRKKTLAGLLLLFIAGNICCALAPGYTTMMLARVLTSLCHGTFFGLAAVVATDLVKPEKRTQAIAMVFMGVSLANILGVPVGTAIGHTWGWRSAFVGVAIIGVLAIVILWRFLPNNLKQQPVSFRKELVEVSNPKVITGLSLSVLCNASLFSLFTYIAPVLGNVSGASKSQITYVLFALGIGLTIGTYLGGKLGDRKMLPWLTRLSGLMIAVLVGCYFSLPNLVPTVGLLMIWSIIGFAFCPMLQELVVKHAANAPLLASAFNQSAFNLGNAMGAWISGTLLAYGAELRELPLVGALLSMAAMLLAIGLSRSSKRRTLTPMH